MNYLLLKIDRNRNEYLCDDFLKIYGKPFDIFRKYLDFHDRRGIKFRISYKTILKIKDMGIDILHFSYNDQLYPDGPIIESTTIYDPKNYYLDITINIDIYTYFISYAYDDYWILTLWIRQYKNGPIIEVKKWICDQEDGLIECLNNNIKSKKYV